MGSLKKKKHKLMEQMVRDAIYESALQILNDKGLDSLTIQRVAEEADIATGTFYNYFKDKDDLLAYSTERILNEIIEVMQEVLDTEKRADEKLTEIIRSVFIYCEKNIRIFKFLEQDRSFTKVELKTRQKKVQQITDILAAAIKEGIDGSIFREVDPQKIADFLHSAMVGTIHVKPDLDRFHPVEDAKQLSMVMSTFLKVNNN